MANTSEWLIDDVTTASQSSGSSSNSGGLEAFYHTNVHNYFASSSDDSPSSILSWDVFPRRDFPPKQERQRWENVFRDWIASLLEDELNHPSAELCEMKDDLAFVARAVRVRVLEHGQIEPKIQFHDRIKQGISVDWKRARKLYREMLQE